ncbi:hypothetical protein MMR14E_00030 [Methylobacterium mesophilicum]
MAASDMVIRPLDPGIPFATVPGACLIVQPLDRVGPARRRVAAVESRAGTGRGPAIRAELDAGDRRRSGAARSGRPA